MKDIDVAGARVRVREWGVLGPTVLMLHGNPDTGAIWEGVASRLAARFHCIAPDLPGFGGSEEAPGYDASLEAQARFVKGVLDALAIGDPVFLVVHDIGGPYGLAWVCEEPERVRRIGIANTMFHSSYRWHTWARVWRTPVLGEISMALMNQALFERELRRGSRKLSRDEIRAVYARVTPAAKRAVLRWYRAMDPERFARWESRLLALTKERVPAIVVWGDHDPYISNLGDPAERFGAREVHHFPESGHWVIAEEPEGVAQRLSAFFGDEGAKSQT